MTVKHCYNCMNELSETAQICPKCGFNNSLPNQPSQALPCGTILNGRYLIGRMLGRGGFGITYIGFDYTLETPVCIKEFFPSGGAMRDPSGKSRVYWSSGSTGAAMKQGRETFVKEAQKAAKVRSRLSVVNIWDVFYENDTAYIVMEYIKGITVKDYLIKRGTVMDAGECLGLLGPVIRDLQGVHEKGIVHRDISPDNLMIGADGKVKLLDLGAAKDLSKGTGQSSTIVHKKGFSPPEQYTERMGIGPWTDVYAMCATIYWCMTGHTPPEAMDRLMGDTLNIPQSIPESVAAVLKHGLELKPENRIRDTDTLVSELESAIGIINNNTNGKKPLLAGVIVGIAAAAIALVLILNGLGIFPKNNSGGSTQVAVAEKTEEAKEEPETEKEENEVEAGPLTEIQKRTSDSPDGTEKGNRQKKSVQAAISGTLSKEKFKEWADRTRVGVTFLNTLDGAPSDAVDLSEAGDGGVLGWKDGGTIYIASEGGVRAPEDCSSLFSDEREKENVDCVFWEKLTNVTGAEFFDMSQVKSTKDMFWKCESLSNIDVSNWDTSSVTDMSFMFMRCSSLTHLDVSKWDTSNVVNMRNVFCGCSSLKNLDVSEWNTSNVTNMRIMFDGCRSLSSIDLSKWDTSKVTDMKQLFCSCEHLTSLDLSKWDTSSVTNMSFMFMHCSSLTYLDVSKWDTSKVGNMTSMFEGTKWENNPPF